MVIHELGHYIITKTYKRKNKSFGMAIWGAFVDPDISHSGKTEKLYIMSGGFLLGMLTGSVAIVIGVYLSGTLSFLLTTFGFLSIFINVTNAIPLFRGNDSYEILKMYFRNSTVAFLFVVSGVVFLLLMSYVYAYGIPLTATSFELLVYGEAVSALILIFMYVFGGRLEAFIPTKEFSKGWHISKRYLAIIKIN